MAKQFCESNLDVYDNTERVVGTWFGKPLYRRSFQNISGTYNESNTQMTYTLLTAVEAQGINLINGWARWYRSGVSTLSPYIGAEAGSLGNPYYYLENISYDSTNGVNVIYMRNATINNPRTIDATIYYTKTSD